MQWVKAANGAELQK